MKMNTKVAKSVFTSFAILTITAAVAQTDCENAKTGIFEMISPDSGKTIIYRTDNTQKEINDSLDYEAISDLIWLDECTYELRNTKLIKGAIELAGKPTDILRVEIIGVEGQNIYVKSSSNFSDLIVEATLTKLK